MSKVIFVTLDPWVEAVGYLLAFCLQRHALELYALCLVFNHAHYDVGHPLEDGPEVEPRFSAFVEEFHWWIFRLLKVCNGWNGPVFNVLERTYQGPSLDAAQIWHDLLYDTAQLVAAGIFRRSNHYNGLCFQPEDVLKPRVFRRNKLIRMLDPERQIFTEETLSVQLGIPRPFKHLSREDYAAEFRRRLDEHEASIAPKKCRLPHKAREYCDSLALGTILGDEDTRTRGQQPPELHTLRPQPVNTTIPELRQAYCELRRKFWDEQRQALAAIRAGETDVLFPAGTYGWRRRLNKGSYRPDSTPWTEQPVWYPD